MIEKERGGFKICNMRADFIRFKVKEALRKSEHLSPERVAYLRAHAKEDAIMHSEINPSFSLGGGPAVKKRNT